MSHRSRVKHVSTIVFAVVLVGCSFKSGDKWRQAMPPTYPARGTVTYKGQPLDAATVVFHPQDGVSASRRAAVGMTDSRGRFVLTTVKPGDGAIAGAYLVTVEKTTTVAPESAAVPDETGAFPIGPHPSAAKPLIPERYFLPDTSGLSGEIKPNGLNEFEFSLR